MTHPTDTIEKHADRGPETGADEPRDEDGPETGGAELVYGPEGAPGPDPRLLEELEQHIREARTAAEETLGAVPEANIVEDPNGNIVEIEYVEDDIAGPRP